MNTIFFGLAILLSSALTSNHNVESIALELNRGKGMEGEEYSRRLQRATNLYLDTHYAEAQSELFDLEALFNQALPSEKNTEVQAMNIYALRFMIEQNLPTSEDIPEEVKTFSGTSGFLGRLPLKVRSALKTESATRALSSTDIPPGTRSFYLFGKRVQLPSHLAEGRYLAYRLTDKELETAYLHVRAEQVVYEKIGTREISELPLANVTVSKSARKKNDSSHLKNSIQTKSFSETPLDRELGLRAELADENSMEKSIFKSPWFWVAVGAVVAGASSYVIYDSTRTKAIHTP